MLFIFSTPELIRHLWQLKTIVFLHQCLICSVPLTSPGDKLTALVCHLTKIVNEPISLQTQVQLKSDLGVQPICLGFWGTNLAPLSFSCIFSHSSTEQRELPNFKVLIIKRVVSIQQIFLCCHWGLKTISEKEKKMCPRPIL